MQIMGLGNLAPDVRRARLFFLGLLAAVSLLRMWFAGVLPLTGDEAYHWEWSRNLSGGYYDHPPLTAYVIRVTTWLLGSSSELGVRFGAILLLAGTSIVLYALARRMASDSGVSDSIAERAGWIAGFLVIVVPIFAGLGVYMSTDPPLVFFCSLSLLCIYYAITRGGWARWVAGGLAVGFCLLSKFLCLFTLAGLFVFLVISPSDRRWFVRPQPYVAGILALIIFLPFLIWNYDNDWATFKFNVVSRQSSNAFAPKHFPEYLLSQMIAVSPFVMMLGIAGICRAWKCWRREKDRVLLFLLCTAVVPLGYFLVVSFTRRVGLHWTACGWLPVLVLLPVLHAREKISLLWMRIMLWTCVALTVLMLAAVSIPPSVISRAQARFFKEENASSFEDERQGWRELGQWVHETREWFRRDQGEKQRGVFLITGQYGVSAALAFYMPGQPRVHLWAPQRTHGEHYRFWDDFPSLVQQDAIYVSKTLKRATKAREVLQQHFVYVHEPEKLSVKVDGVEVRSFYLVKCFIYDGLEPAF